MVQSLYDSCSNSKKGGYVVKSKSLYVIYFNQISERLCADRSNCRCSDFMAFIGSNSLIGNIGVRIQIWTNIGSVQTNTPHFQSGGRSSEFFIAR